MGSCQKNNVIEINSLDRNGTKNQNKDNNYYFTKFPSISEQKLQFPDMNEWEGERYSGIGIKKLKGYKCTLPIDQLNKIREDFWSNRNNHHNINYKIWRIINQACVYDEYRANLLLEEYELKTAEGCINHIIDTKGNHYYVPNYCINDPYFEKSFNVNIEEINEEKLKLIFYEVGNNINVELEVSNLLTGEELKDLYIKKTNKNINDFNIRFFFSGNEIKNNQFIYQHKLKDEYKIMVMVTQKINDNNNNNLKTTNKNLTNNNNENKEISEKDDNNESKKERILEMIED